LPFEIWSISALENTLDRVIDIEVKTNETDLDDFGDVHWCGGHFFRQFAVALCAVLPISLLSEIQAFERVLCRKIERRNEGKFSNQFSLLNP